MPHPAFRFLILAAVACGGEPPDATPDATRDGGRADARDPREDDGGRDVDGGGGPIDPPPPVPSLEGRMTPPTSYDPTGSYAWDPPPADLVVNALEPGAPETLTLAEALAMATDGVVIRIAPELAGAVLQTREPLEVRRSVTIDASAAPGFTIDAEGRAGGIRVGRDLHTTLVGLSIRNVVSEALGGGVFVDQADGEARGSLTVVGCVFENNVGAAAGGLYVRRRIDSVIRDSIFRGNRASEATGDDMGKYGGAISARSAGSLRVERVVFSDNDAPGQAGALYSIAQAVTVVHSVFVNNGGDAGHGAMLTDGGDVRLDGVLFQGNRGRAFGGAVQLYGYASAGDELTIQRTVFVDNETTNDKGGAAYLIGASIRIDTSVFVRNRSRQDAGAIYLPGSGPVHIVNSLFGENECTSRSGGGFRADAGEAITIERSMFVRNVAGESGGAFWMQPSLAGRVSATIFSENQRGQLVARDVTNGGENLFFPIPEMPSSRWEGSTYADPLLGPLEERNGVWWYPPMPGSPTSSIGPVFPETRD